MEKYRDSPNFDCTAKPGAGVARMGRHTDQERRSRERAAVEGDLGTERVYTDGKWEAWVSRRFCKDGTDSLPWRPAAKQRRSAHEPARGQVAHSCHPEAMASVQPIGIRPGRGGERPRARPLCLIFLKSGRANQGQWARTKSPECHRSHPESPGPSEDFLPGTPPHTLLFLSSHS